MLEAAAVLVEQGLAGQAREAHHLLGRAEGQGRVLQRGLRDYVLKNKFDSVVFGLSGGMRLLAVLLVARLTRVRARVLPVVPRVLAVAPGEVVLAAASIGSPSAVVKLFVK